MTLASYKFLRERFTALRRLDQFYIATVTLVTPGLLVNHICRIHWPTFWNCFMVRAVPFFFVAAILRYSVENCFFSVFRIWCRCFRLIRNSSFEYFWYLKYLVLWWLRLNACGALLTFSKKKCLQKKYNDNILSAICTFFNHFLEYRRS